MPVHARRQLARIRRHPAARSLVRWVQQQNDRTKLTMAGTAAFLLLFGIGAMIGSSADVQQPVASTLPPIQRTLAGFGLGEGRFECSITSDPAGARVTIDGKSVAMATPTLVEMPPGTHKITLSLSRYGARTIDVTGRRGERVPISVTLWGSIQVRLPRHDDTPVHVSVDGEDRGLAPTFLDHITPGPHDLEFAVSAQQQWGRTIEVRIGDVTEVTAHTFDTPATGILEVGAAVEDESGTSNVGARVWVDGKPRGKTPLTMNLPRGPHSVRGEYDGEQSAVQVIDLPGGNRRFANIRFENDAETFRLVTRIERAQTRGSMAVTATLRGVRALDLASMWLHVRCGDGVWRRLPMEIAPISGGASGTTELQPSELLKGSVPVYYVSALRITGEEYFTEIAPASRTALAMR
jgi:hypothetical protein